MRYDHDVIGRDCHIELQRIHPDPEGACETDHRILGKQASGSAVAVQFDFVAHRHRVGCAS